MDAKKKRYQSGSQKRKMQESKQTNINEQLKKIPKLTTFFHTATKTKDQSKPCTSQGTEPCTSQGTDIDEPTFLKDISDGEPEVGSFINNLFQNKSKE